MVVNNQGGGRSSVNFAEGEADKYPQKVMISAMFELSCLKGCVNTANNNVPCMYLSDCMLCILYLLICTIC